MLESFTDLQDAATRLVVAVVFGLIVGLDREVRHKPAGLRTHGLVSLTVAAFTILTFELSATALNLGDNARADPVRLIQAVIAGVAFLGAGAIVRAGSTISGVTTGTTIWLAGAIGLASGAAQYGIAAITLVLGLTVTTLIGWLERRIANQQRDHRARIAAIRPEADHDHGPNGD